MSSRHMKLDRADFVLPCPFCGSYGVELLNTHTAAYWIACECGAEMHSKPFGSRLASSKQTAAHHRKAKASALAKWNARETES